jgi:hypothetical protein
MHSINQLHIKDLQKVGNLKDKASYFLYPECALFASVFLESYTNTNTLFFLPANMHPVHRPSTRLCRILAFLSEASWCFYRSDGWMLIILLQRSQSIR